MFEISGDDDCDLWEVQMEDFDPLVSANHGIKENTVTSGLKSVREITSNVVSSGHSFSRKSDQMRNGTVDHKKHCMASSESINKHAMSTTVVADPKFVSGKNHYQEDCGDLVESRNNSVLMPEKRNVRGQKRKFPGPAGLLPKLDSDQPFDIVTSVPLTTEKQKKKAPQIPSSQSGEDTFNNAPWQMLLADLDDDGNYWLDKFSIASNLLEAKKKMLPGGKIPLLFAMIDNLEWHQADASITLKDKSGKILGTVHREIFKEYEEEFQVGSAVILRGVGVISPTTRAHYLNITLSNIVNIYHSKSKHKLQQPLKVVLQAVERDTENVISQMKSVKSSCRKSMGQSSVSTPQPNISVQTSLRSPAVGSLVHCSPQRKMINNNNHSSSVKKQLSDTSMDTPHRQKYTSQQSVEDSALHRLACPTDSVSLNQSPLLQRFSGKCDKMDFRNDLSVKHGNTFQSSDFRNSTFGTALSKARNQINSQQSVQPLSSCQIASRKSFTESNSKVQQQANACKTDKNSVLSNIPHSNVILHKTEAKTDLMNVEHSSVHTSANVTPGKRSFSFKSVIKSPVYQSNDTTVSGISRSNVTTSEKLPEQRSTYASLEQSSVHSVQEPSKLCEPGKPQHPTLARTACTSVVQTLKMKNNAVENQREAVNSFPRSSANNNCDSVWQDDISDELLSQLSDEMM